MPASCRFEWIDGALTRAVLDNANLCNPTVLDRLNPLLEPEGCLLLNEAGSADGQPRILKAHTDFRLFLAMDPRSAVFHSGNAFPTHSFSSCRIVGLPI